MTRVLHGVVHGKTIELETETGLPDGRQVEVFLRAKALPGPPPGWKPGSSKTAAGMMASSWTEEDDRVIEEIYKDRKQADHREIAE